MSITRRQALLAAPCMLAGVTGAPGALAQAAPWASRPITLVLPSTAGGTSDAILRMLEPRLQELWRQPVVVDYKPGAGSLLGTEYVVKAKPDGHTLLLGFTDHAFMASLYPKARFNAVTDLARVTTIASVPLVVLAKPSLKADTLQDLIQLAKASRGKLNFSSAGMGTTQHLAGELFMSTAGVQMVHVPFKGGTEATNSLIGGQVDVMFQLVSSAAPHVKAGRLKALAIGAPRRSSALPDVPTSAEAGLPDFQTSIWYAFYAPAATPPELVARINADVNRVLAIPDVQARLQSMGLDPMRTATPAEFENFYRAEVERWSKAVKSARIQLE